jgi:hypothetical protein
MNKKIIIKILTDAGGKLWEKTTDRGELSRIYFNTELVSEFIALDVSHYNSGNICGAYLDGSRISNSAAGRILSSLVDGKIFYDFADDKFHWTTNYGGHVRDYCRALRQMLDEADTESDEIIARLDTVTA